MKRVVEVDLIRPIAILLVIFTHCFAIYNGGWENPDPANIALVPHYQLLTSFLSAFRMPSVILVAGYIYAYFDEKKTTTLWELIVSKAKRLLIPAFVFGVVYFLLYREFDLKDLIVEVSAGAGHLWFLPMLFWNFIFGYFLVKIRNPNFGMLALIIIYACSAVSGAIPNIFGISRAIYFTPYYYIGILLWRHRSYIVNKLVNTRNILFLTSIFIVIFTLTKSHEFGTLAKSIYDKVAVLLIHYLIQTLGVMCFYAVVMLYVKNNEEPKVYKPLIKLSYGIYVFHQFILMALIYKLHVYKYLDYRVLPFVLFIVTICTSVILTNIFLRTKVGKFLIG